MNKDVRYPTASEHADRLTEQLRLALEIADEATRSDIEGFCASHGEGGYLWWYANTAADPENSYEAMAVERAVRYLDMREQIVHHASAPTLIRFKKK